MRNLYFDLTEELNAEGPIAVLASGLDLPEAHRRVCELAERRLPPDPFSLET